ncbi:MAG: hypothetical protein V4726_05865 [Verrucomicrobiota bacterium]
MSAGTGTGPRSGTGTPKEVEKLQRAALYRLFTALYWRGRQTLRNQSAAKSTIMARKYVPLLLYILIGMALLPFAAMKVPPMVFATMPHAMTLMLAGMAMASACGTLLFNDQESDILLHRPVPARLILIAKVRVLFVQTVSLALALNTVIMIASPLRGGGSWRYVPAHIFSVALEALFCVGAVVLAFQLCVKLFGQARLQSLITISQVLMAMFLMLGSQLAPRLMRTTDFVHWDTSPWLMALPPAWFGALDTLAVTLQPTPPLLAGAGLALGLTALITWLAFVRLAGTYEEAVVTLNEHTSSPGPVTGGKKRWAERLAHLPGMRWWLRDPVERIGFLLTAVQLTRARDVKLRVYPQIAQFILYPIIFSIGTRGDSSGFAGGAVAGFLGIIPLTAVSLLRYSEEYRGAELFRFAPLTSPAALFFGARKAAMVLVVLPVVVVWSVLLLVISRDASVLLLLLPGLIVAHVISLLPSVNSPFLPFSETQADSKSMGLGCLTMILGLGSALAIGVVSAIARSYGYFTVWLLFLMITGAACDWVFRRAIRRHAIASDE